MTDKKKSRSRRMTKAQRDADKMVTVPSDVGAMPWIPVTERLPDTGGDYGEVVIAHWPDVWTGTAQYSKADGWYWAEQDSGGPCDADPTHWMPIPAIPGALPRVPEALLDPNTDAEAMPWIPVTERLPKRNSNVFYWNPNGYPAIADEWRNEHHLKSASHWMPVTIPAPADASGQKGAG